MNQDDMLECPDCRRPHDEPADATLGRFVRCLDCAIEQRESQAARATLGRAA